MRGATDKQTESSLPASQRAALVSLLADDDPAIHRYVRDKLLSFGSKAGEWLRPHLLSNDPVMRRRAQEIVHHLGRSNSHQRFLDFCLHHGEEFDLEQAAGLLAETQYPDIHWEGYQALLDQWSSELLDQLETIRSQEHQLPLINEFLFENLGFSGDDFYADTPESSYLNRVLDERTGNPISLCAIYLFVCWRLCLPVVGIGLPGHFVCRFQTATKEIYIDVFNRGRFWTKADCIRLLMRTNHSLREGYLAPVSARRMLLRMCANLHQTYASLDMSDEASRVQKYLVALAR